MSEIDAIKTTITVSLGFKNRLRDLKGTESYETYLSQLLRSKNEVASENQIEFAKFERQRLVHTFDSFKIVFSYNKNNHSPNFHFDISLSEINSPETGMPITYEDFQRRLTDKYRLVETKDSSNNLQIIRKSYELYFELLTSAIQKEIEPLFRHRGRFEDHDRWKKEFESLGLSSNAFENDVMEKLEDFQQGEMFR